MNRGKAIVLGGAGFIGSHLVRALSNTGFVVAVIDGLLDQTGGNKENLEGLKPPACDVAFTRLEAVPDLAHMLQSVDLVFDLMALTSHQFGFDHPQIDADLNLMSHIALIKALSEASYSGRVVYFGSRGQYGNVSTSPFDEMTPLNPLDPQGVHKTAVEQLLALFAKRVGFSCDSLRITNCFGPRQKAYGKEIGLVAHFIRELLFDREVEVYGSGSRVKDLLFVGDLIDTTMRLIEVPGSGFRALNVGGQQVTISGLLDILQKLCGSGSYKMRPFPKDLLQSDTGDAVMDSGALESVLGGCLIYSDLEESLRATVLDFKDRLGVER